MATNIGPQLKEMLERYGLGNLAPWVSQRITAGASPEQIELEMYDQPAFIERFPAIRIRGREGWNPLSVDEYLAYEHQARAVMRAYGLPPSFYDTPGSFTKLLVNDVSMEELTQRLDMVSTRVATAAPQVRAVFGELFGAAADSAMFTLFTDPDLATPELERMVQQAEFGGAGRRFGFEIGNQMMERAGAHRISYDQAIEGFAKLDVSRGLFAETIAEEDEDDLEVIDEGVEAQFGLEGGAAGKVQKRAEQRVGSTAGQAGGTQEERGPSGLGGAGRR